MQHNHKGHLNPFELWPLCILAKDNIRSASQNKLWQVMAWNLSIRKSVDWDNGHRYLVTGWLGTVKPLPVDWDLDTVINKLIKYILCFLLYLTVKPEIGPCWTFKTDILFVTRNNQPQKYLNDKQRNKPQNKNN